MNLKIRIKRKESVYIKLLMINILIALYGSSDMLYSVRPIIPVFQSIVILCLFLCVIYSFIRKKNSVDSCDCIALLFIAYLFCTQLWSTGRNLYNFGTNILYITTAFLSYYILKHYGTKEDDFKIYNILIKSLYIDLIIVIYQILIKGINSDFANGIFGSIYYYNGIQGLFCLICCLWSLYLQINKRKTMKHVIVVILFTCFINALTEIKTFFFLFAVIILLYFLFEFGLNFQSLKRILLFLCIGIAIAFSLNILETMYAQNTVVFKSIDGLINYIKPSNDMVNSHTRFGGIQAFFDNRIDTILLGNGFGGQTVYSVYGFASMLNAVGVLGITILMLFFIANIYRAKKMSEDGSSFHITIIYSVICVMALITWAGIFGSVVSAFSFIILGVAGRIKTTD